MTTSVTTPPVDLKGQYDQAQVPSNAAPEMAPPGGSSIIGSGHTSHPAGSYRGPKVTELLDSIAVKI
jgi:hypothetical protein